MILVGRVFSIRRSPVRAFVVPFRLLRQKNMTGNNVLFKNWCLLVVKNTEPMSTKKDLGTSYEFFQNF